MRKRDFAEAELAKQGKTMNEMPLPVSPALDILYYAASILQERGAARDQASGERSMKKIVAIFQALTGVTLSEYEGWKFMQAVKLARQTLPFFRSDDYVDSINYEALAAECRSQGREARDNPACQVKNL